MKHRPAFEDYPHWQPVPATSGFRRDSLVERVAIGILWIVLGFVLLAGLLACLPGCAPTASALATQAKVDAIHAKAQTDAAKAEADPTTHPILAGKQVIKNSRAPLELAAGAGFLALLIGIGLRFVAALAWLGKIIAPIGGAVFLGSLALLFALPFLPWILGGLLLLLLGWYGWEWWRTKSPISAEKAIITEIREIVPGTAPAAPAKA